MKLLNVFLVDRENFGLSILKKLVNLFKEYKIIGIFLIGYCILVEGVLLKCGVVIIVMFGKVFILLVVYVGLKKIYGLIIG